MATRDQREGLPDPWTQRVGDSYVEMTSGVVMIIVRCGNCGQPTSIPWVNSAEPKGLCMPCVRQLRGGNK